MKYYIKDLRTGMKSRPFGCVEALESFLSEFSRYTYDYNKRKYKYEGNSLIDNLVCKSLSEYNKNLKKVKQLIEADSTVFYLPDCVTAIAKKEWFIYGFIKRQVAEEKALDILMADSVMHNGMYSRNSIFIKGSIMIVNEKGGIYDYTDFIATSRTVDSEYFKKVYNETRKRYTAGIYYNRKWVLVKPKVPEYRKGAIPFTGHYKHYRRRRCGVSSHERWLDVENVREYEEDIEYAVRVKGIRSKRKHIYAGYNTPASHPSWKEKKCKKQWMRGNKGIRKCNKRIYQEEISI